MGLIPLPHFRQGADEIREAIENIDASVKQRREEAAKRAFERTIRRVARDLDRDIDMEG